MSTWQEFTENEPIGFTPRRKLIPTISLKAVFAENEDLNSMGYNLDEDSGAGLFFKQLQKIQNRADVENVLIEIIEDEVSEIYNEDTEVISQRIYIVTTASREEVWQWLTPLTPDGIDQGNPKLGLGISSADSKGNIVFAVWWNQHNVEQNIDADMKTNDVT